MTQKPKDTSKSTCGGPKESIIDLLVFKLVLCLFKLGLWLFKLGLLLFKLAHLNLREYIMGINNFYIKVSFLVQIK